MVSKMECMTQERCPKCQFFGPWQLATSRLEKPLLSTHELVSLTIQTLPNQIVQTNTQLTPHSYIHRQNSTIQLTTLMNLKLTLIILLNLKICT